MRCPGVMASLHDAWKAVARSFGGTAASAAAAAALAAERGGRRWPARLGLEASLPLPADSCWGALLRLGMDPRFLLGLVIGWKVVAEVGALGAVLLASLFKMAVGCAAGYCRRVPKGRCCTATGQPPAAQQRVSSASKVPRLAPHSALQLLKGRRPTPAPPDKVRVHTVAARSPPPPRVLPPLLLWAQLPPPRMRCLHGPATAGRSLALPVECYKYGGPTHACPAPSRAGLSAGCAVLSLLLSRAEPR